MRPGSPGRAGGRHVQIRDFLRSLPTRRDRPRDTPWTLQHLDIRGFLCLRFLMLCFILVQKNIPTWRKPAAGGQVGWELVRPRGLQAALAVLARQSLLDPGTGGSVLLGPGIGGRWPRRERSEQPSVRCGSSDPSSWGPHPPATLLAYQSPLLDKGNSKSWKLSIRPGAGCVRTAGHCCRLTLLWSRLNTVFTLVLCLTFLLPMTAAMIYAVPCLPRPICPTAPSAPCRQGLVAPCLDVSSKPGARPQAAHVMVTQSRRQGAEGQRGTWGPGCKPRSYPSPTGPSVMSPLQHDVGSLGQLMEDSWAQDFTAGQGCDQSSKSGKGAQIQR